MLFSNCITVELQLEAVCPSWEWDGVITEEGAGPG